MTIVKKKGEACFCPNCGAKDRFEKLALFEAKQNTSVIMTILMGLAATGTMMHLLNHWAVEPFEDSFIYTICALIIFFGLIVLSGFVSEGILRLLYPLGACKCQYCDSKFTVKHGTKGLYVLVGPSGCGKSTVLSWLTEWGYSSLASITNRPRRTMTESGHMFVTSNEMSELLKNHTVYTHTVFDRFHYFVIEEQLNCADVCTIEAEGCVDLKKRYRQERPVHFIYLQVSDDEREKRMRKRGDTEEQIQRRLENDAEVFDGFQEGADMVVDASKPAVYVAWQILQYIKKCEKTYE